MDTILHKNKDKIITSAIELSILINMIIFFYSLFFINYVLNNFWKHVDGSNIKFFSIWK